MEDITSQLSLVLISASSASENEFKLLHQARLGLQEVIILDFALLIKKNFNREGLSQRLYSALLLQTTASMWSCSQFSNLGVGHSYLSAVQCLHFFFKYSPPNGYPAQCIWGWEDGQAETLTRFHLIYIKPLPCCSLWAQCYRLGACLRGGSSSPEITLLKENGDISSNTRQCSNSFMNEPAADHALAYSTLESGVCISC